MWGVATSAYQVEGGNTTADWYLFEEIEGAIQDGDRAGIAADHYNRFEQDFDLCQQYGIEAYRFSLEWSRIEPERDVYDLVEVEHYRQVLQALRQRDITPVVTLHHFTLPQWVLNPSDPENDLDGWESLTTVDEFVDYVAFVAEEFGGEVDWWITINEPVLLAMNGYLSGDYPPGKEFDVEALQTVRANLIFAHARAYDQINANDRIDADGDRFLSRVSFAKNIMLFDPLDPESAEDQDAADKWRYFYDESFLNTLSTGQLDVDLDGLCDSDETIPPEGFYPELKAKLDFLSMNYYVRIYARYEEGISELVPFLSGIPLHSEAEDIERNDLGWEIYHEGLYRAIQYLWSNWPQWPIMISESGIITRNNYQKTLFLLDTIKEIERAREDQMPVFGFFVWSLLDTFEWHYGNMPGFGLFAVKPESLDRVATSGVNAYRDIIAEGGVTPEIEEQYRQPEDFLWGAGICSYEAEGGNYFSDWYLWEQFEGTIAGGSRAGLSADHYNRFIEDFDLLVSMGGNSFRFSVEWARVEPARDQIDQDAINHYHAVLDALLERGITPILCLQQRSLPIWVQDPVDQLSDLDGWTSEETAQEFLEYAGLMAEEFGSKVDLWQTVNEPIWDSLGAYLVAVFPPGCFFQEEMFLGALTGMANAHALAYDSIKELDTVDADGDGRAAEVSLAKSINVFEPYDPDDPVHQEAVPHFELFFNWAVLDWVTTGDLDYDLDGIVDVHLEQFENRLDFISITYYSRFLALPDGTLPILDGIFRDPVDPELEYQDNGWEMYPNGLYRVSREAYERYALPILITEHGIVSADDPFRARSLVKCQDHFQNLRYEGIPMMGYLSFPMLDGFSWEHGLTDLLGLVSVDFEDFTRSVNPMVTAYTEIVEADGVDYRIRNKSYDQP